MSPPRDFSIEMAAERIVDARTRDYFREAYNSYSNGNYRSAVVMLWSVVVCDVLFKLDELRSLHSDKTAEAILTEIEDQQKKNPKSPEWELSLLEKVRDRTSLIDLTEFGNLAFLQQHRHLSAHPVLTTGYTLFSPTREAVRAHIRSALEGLLTKPSVMTKKVFNAFVEDLEHIQNVLVDDVGLRKYLESKYFPHMLPHVEDSIFRSLWRLVFKVADASCEKNRDINFRALRILLGRRAQEIATGIQAEREYYSSIASSGTPMEKIFELLGEYPQLYSLLTDAARVLIQGYARQNDNQAISAWFISGSVGGHVSVFLERAKSGALNVGRASHSRLVSIAAVEGFREQAIEVGVHLYVKSKNFDVADERFSGLVEPYLDVIAADQLLICLQGIEVNNQTYWRGRAKIDHGLLNDACVRVWGSAFNPAQYPHFASSL
ncbi:hypothetical protein [Myxococcus xanthus]|uniref:hypothetical protein n=1 Tax=Myxococcus xanthus TaxID=34 RepID=UPI001126A014|nr:hypothetical protein [Myxococcus xanthus]